MFKVKMKPAILLMLVMFLLLGLVSAMPLNVDNTSSGTPTPAVGPSRVVPRRNGHSDLPASYTDYAAAHSNNAIPVYVMASSPLNLDNRNAIRYDRDTIYAALSQGYEVLQRTRDPRPGNWQLSGNVRYPAPVMYFTTWNLAPTHLGDFGFTSEANPRTGRIYMYPMVWGGVWVGPYNQAPGFDRIVFNEDGVYLGIVTRRWDFGLVRPGTPLVSTVYRWCPAVNENGDAIAQLRPDPLGWDWTGQPPLLGSVDLLGYVNPDVWRSTNLMRRNWALNNPGIQPGLGGSGMISINGSGTASAIDALFPQINASDPLYWPPEDNSTGTWRIWTPTNDTATEDGPGDEFIPDDCKYAASHNQKIYWQQCQSDWSGGSQLKYRITITGTGQGTDGWCSGIMQNIHGQCGGNGNPSRYYSCNTKYPATVDWVLESDSKGSHSGIYYYGIDMHFSMNWPWAESDADHICVSKAVQKASCFSAGVQASNGRWCRAISYYNPNDMEWSEDMGTPN